MVKGKTGWIVLDWFGLDHTDTLTEYYCYREIMLAEYAYYVPKALQGEGNEADEQKRVESM